MSLGFAVCGWLCVFKTDMLVIRGQENYAKSGLVRAYPFSNMVLKPWYPIYIRRAGIFIWLWVAGFDYLVLTHRLHWLADLLMCGRALRRRRERRHFAFHGRQNRLRQRAFQSDGQHLVHGVHEVQLHGVA